MLRILLLLTLIYPGMVVAQQDARLTGLLPQEVYESSGLIFYNGRFVTHNDSGNPPRLYELDSTSLEVVRTISLRNAANTDWEDICQDENYIYIGDIGNNTGDRRDLRIYRISKAEYDLSEEVDVEVIAFAYDDQEDFSTVQNSDWDAEALIISNGQLVVFTKQWQSNGTRAYTVPAIPGTYSARFLGSFALNGLATGAVLNKETSVAYLCGYNRFLQPFLLRIPDFDLNNPFGGTVLKTTLQIGMAQVEGITCTDAGSYYLSTELFVNSSPAITLEAGLYTFRSGDTVPDLPPPPESPPGEPGEEPPGEQPIPDEGAGRDGLLIFSGFGSKALEYSLTREEPVFGRAIYDQHGRLVHYTHGRNLTESSIDLSTLASAVYYLTFYLQGKTISKPFILR